MEIRIDLWQTIPLFIAASVIGIVSMIPGEIGSFDVMMIIGLSAIGVPREMCIRDRSGQILFSSIFFDPQFGHFFIT